jgi:hypothetical protein
MGTTRRCGIQIQCSDAAFERNKCRSEQTRKGAKDTHRVALGPIRVALPECRC